MDLWSLLGLDEGDVLLEELSCDQRVVINAEVLLIDSGSFSISLLVVLDFLLNNMAVREV